MKIDWSEHFIYDETSPTKLRWKTCRVGRNGSLVKRKNNGVAGHIKTTGGVYVNLNKESYSVKDIVWEMFNSPIGEGDRVLFLNSDINDVSIENLYLFQPIESEHAYDKYLSKYLEVDETSPSGMRWKMKYDMGSTIKVGDVAGSLDKSDGYWKLHAFGRHLKVHKIVWAFHNNFQDQTRKHIDHMNGVRSDNSIENLRLVEPVLNARNQKKQRISKTGVNGVSYSEPINKNGVMTPKYTAVVYVDGKRKAKTYSVTKYGKEKAFEMACEWRASMIEWLNSNGAGYTERHGV